MTEVADRGSSIDQAVDRSLRGRRAAAAGEVRRLVDASLAIIRRTGDLEPRVSEIVREAGLHNQAFYRHFRSKHELLVAVLDEGIRGLAGYLAHRMAVEDSPRARVRAWLGGILDQASTAERNWNSSSSTVASSGTSTWNANTFIGSRTHFRRTPSA